jgi:aldehyde dehydrogenase (NAD+)
MFERTDHFVAGKWMPAAGSEVIEVISPSTEQVCGRVPVATAEEIDAAVAAARLAFDHGPWPRLSLAERADYLRRLIDGALSTTLTALPATTQPRSMTKNPYCAR